MSLNINCYFSFVLNFSVGKTLFEGNFVPVYLKKIHRPYFSNNDITVIQDIQKNETMKPVNQ